MGLDTDSQPDLLAPLAPPAEDLARQPGTIEGPPGWHEGFGAGLRVWCGPALGWIGFDPTNACLARTDHPIPTRALLCTNRSFFIDRRQRQCSDEGTLMRPWHAAAARPG